MQKYDYDKLVALYKQVAYMTTNHRELGDNAVVWPSDLGKALEKVNPEWWKDAQKPEGYKD